MAPHVVGLSRSEDKKPRAFRMGLMRRISGGFAYKAAAKVGLASDGGVWVMPYEQCANWSYGVLQPREPESGEHLTTTVTPKLHYHRSGIVSATPPTGQDFERRRLAMTPLPQMTGAQFLSIACMRTWALPTRPKGAAAGDDFTPVLRWPDVAIWTVFVLEASEDERRSLLTPGFPSAGLLAGETFTHRVVSLAAYGRQAVLVVTVRTEDHWPPLPDAGGTTIAAVPSHTGAWPIGASGPAEFEAFGLWSSAIHNPLIKWEKDLPTTLEPASTTSEKTIEDSFDELAETTIPDGGFAARTRAVGRRPRAESAFVRDDG